MVSLPVAAALCVGSCLFVHGWARLQASGWPRASGRPPGVAEGFAERQGGPGAAGRVSAARALDDMLKLGPGVYGDDAGRRSALDERLADMRRGQRGWSALVSDTCPLAGRPARDVEPSSGPRRLAEYVPDDALHPGPPNGARPPTPPRGREQRGR